MKLKCGRCDREEARLFCCADEAAFCFECDQKIHSVDQPVSKHQRVSLSSSSASSPRPKCDICQETVGYFLCLEDRALLCRKCDVSIHTLNPFVSSHQRFLLVGPKVGLESTYEMAKSTPNKISSKSAVLPQKSVTTSGQDGNSVSADGGNKVVGLTTANSAISTDTPGKEIVDLFCTSSDNCPSSQDETSKAEGKVHGNSEWWKILHSTEEELLNGEWTIRNDGAPSREPQLLGQHSPQRDLVSSKNIGGSSSHNTRTISNSGGSPLGADSQNHFDSAFSKRKKSSHF
ncbi:OLC1v1023597C1 [Oldenlandia corymbosa var. corymbosa]|uniref:OLC1v1023597C1 n=1 Tax=Oldenlandia corymbosa var. corymbosa TaxID=529605 RepID=A0AAV1C168_OLDCO|nr:OLC1v1023597C1 [Oldenlandia corymbosa var. corymbosa]